jgi:tRNA nucleotidyltransferase (CCA-adding enzyme)
LHLLRRRDVKPSGVVTLLDRYPAASIAALAGTTGDEIAASLMLRYLGEWRHIHPALRGDDLIAMGVPEGPRVQQGLQLIRAAKLDGTARDLADERMLALRLARSIHDARVMSADIDVQVNGN